MKHLIFIGKRGTGKSLFAKLIFGGEKTLHIDGRSAVNSPFFLDSGKENWDFEKIIIDDIANGFRFSRFYEDFSHSKMVLQRKYKKLEIVKTPLFILIIDGENETFINDKAFLSKFHVIDFDKNTIADLTKIINEEKIIIKTDY